MSQRPEILVVTPDHYRVSYRINPWMQPETWARDAPGLQRAAAESHAAFRLALQQAGCSLIERRGAPDAPDMVFPANAAIVLDGRALMARFRHTQRKLEEAPFLAMFREMPAPGRLQEIGLFPPSCHQEGAGDCIWDAGRAHFWAGYGPRSDVDAVSVIEDFFGKPVVSLELASERCYHLDVCFCPLSGGEILYYPAALTAQARRTLYERVPRENLIEADDDDLSRFNVNAVNVGRELVMSRAGPRLRAVLAERGYRIREVDLSPFMLSGGGAYCMTLRLDRSSLAPQGEAFGEAATEEERTP